MAAYSGNWNGAPSSTGGSRGGGNSASPYMRNGMFTARGEGPFTSIAVQTGKYLGIPSGFSSASPFMQGGIFRAQGEGPFRSPGIQPPGLQNRGYTGTTGPAGGGGASPTARQLPPPVSGLMGRPVFGPPPAAPLTKAMLPAFFGDSLNPASGYNYFAAGRAAPTNKLSQAINMDGSWTRSTMGPTNNSYYNNPTLGTPGFGGLANYGSPLSGGR